MAVVNNKGQVMANLSHVIKVFKTEKDFITFQNQLAAAKANINAFAIFKCWEKPYTLLVDGVEAIINEDQVYNHTPEIPDFQPDHNYILHEAITHNGLLYRAKVAFLSGANFAEGDWELISRVIHAIEDFVPNHHYAKNELILHGGVVYIAKSEFTSGAVFAEADWQKITDEEHVFFYDILQNYAAKNLVVDHEAKKLYVAIQDVPAGTALTDEEYYICLTPDAFAIPAMTQAEYDALEVKPTMAQITDSVYDIKI